MQNEAKADERKRWLLNQLGNKCAHCSTTENLEFDCIVPIGWQAHGSGKRARMLVYMVQHAKKNLQLLCGQCNRRKGVLDKEELLALRAAMKAGIIRDDTRAIENDVERFRQDIANQVPKSHQNLVKQPVQPPETDWEVRCRKMREKLGL